MVSLELPTVLFVGKGEKHVTDRFSYGNMPYSDKIWLSLKVKFIVVTISSKKV